MTAEQWWALAFLVGCPALACLLTILTAPRAEA